MANRIEENFTPTQITVLEKMWTTSTVAPIRRYVLNPEGGYLRKPEGGYVVEHIERPTRPIDFALPGEFVLKLHDKRPDDPLSPYYVNLRELPDDLLISVAQSIREATVDLYPGVCTGIPNAGDPIARRYSELSEVPVINLFGKAEGNSGSKIVAGVNAPQGNGQRLIILDDLITEADTKFEAAEVAKELGYEIVGFGVLVDRQQGGAELLRIKGFKVRAPIPISRAFAYYLNTGKINGEMYERSMNYLNTARSSAKLSPFEIAI